MSNALSQEKGKIPSLMNLSLEAYLENLFVKRLNGIRLLAIKQMSDDALYQLLRHYFKKPELAKLVKEVRDLRRKGLFVPHMMNTEVKFWGMDFDGLSCLTDGAIDCLLDMKRNDDELSIDARVNIKVFLKSLSQLRFKETDS